MEALATEYPTVKFYAWDVVNEAVDPNTSDGMRTPGSNNKNPEAPCGCKPLEEIYC